MIAYIKGKVVQVNLDSLIVENAGIGYEVFFARPETITLNQDIHLYTYHKVAEDEQSLFGFLKLSEFNGAVAGLYDNNFSHTNFASFPDAVYVLIFLCS